MSHFFAMLSRMKFINRWALMRNVSEESLCLHSYETAVLAHALCVIGNRRLGKRLDGERAAVLALYHDASEIITGDMPTPIKYFNSEIKGAYKEVEAVANRKLLSYLPEDLKPDFEGVLMPEGEDEYLLLIIKAADKLSALIKCVEEIKMGNQEFANARESTAEAVRALNCAEADIFIKEFLGSYSLTLDELF